MLEIPLVCVVTDLDRVDYDVILPAAVVSELQAPAVSDVLSVGDASSVNPVTQTADFSGQVEPSEVDILNVDDIPEDNVEGDSTVLIAEQKADPCTHSVVLEGSRGGEVRCCYTSWYSVSQRPGGVPTRMSIVRA